MINVLRRLADAARQRQRLSGEPRSANGASSFHLAWDIPPIPLQQVSATVEVLELPRVRRLYFWALQVTFAAENTLRGGAHLGLQWNPRHPGNTAANWGGYAPDGSLLRGTDSILPSTPRDPNTRDFPWSVGRRYRLQVTRAPEQPDGVHAWRGTITDLDRDRQVTVRDLVTTGSHLTAPIVWTEAFARCEQPPVVVRWSDLEAIDDRDRKLVVDRVRVNYQPRADGGCDNTSVTVDELGVVQSTATTRRVPQGSLLPVSRGRPA